MKRFFVTLAFLATMGAQAQFYVSATGGYSLGIPSSKISEEKVNGGKKNNYGTFGEGFNTQLRMGYFFNKTWGVDVGLGYLHGADQVKEREVFQRDRPVAASVDGKVIARGRVFGLSLSAICNFTNNFYGRFGILTKVGGKTEALATSTTTTSTPIPIAAVSSFMPAEMGGQIAQLQGAGYDNILIEQGARIETEYTSNFHGKMPFGTIAALGYKYNVSKNVSIFAEIEYMNIGVKSDYSELQNFNQNFVATITANGTSTGAIAAIPAGTPLPERKIPVNATLKTLDTFTDGVYEDRLREQVYFKKTTYVDELSATETDRSKKISDKVSYSSLGFNIGVTYSF